MGRILFTALVGGLAGLVAWAVAAPFDPGTYPSPDWARYEHIYIFALCGLVGISLGAVNGAYQGGKLNTLRGAAVGVLIGTIGGYIGYAIGTEIVQAIFQPDQMGSGFGGLQIIVRIIGIAPLGAMLGLVLGATARSWRQALVGLVGGALGAGIGAAVFDLVGAVLAPAILAARGQSAGEVGSPSRAILAVAIGLGLGLFTSIAQRVTRTAWVRLILGRNEAKEWIVDAPNTFIGRNETLHIPIFGDPGVAPIHAVIQRDRGNYYLADYGSGAPTLLNGVPVQQVPLFSGAIITVGSSNLEFVLRAGSAPQRAAEAYRSQFPMPQGAVPAGYQAYGAPQPAGQPYAQPGVPAQGYPQQPVQQQPYQQPVAPAQPYPAGPSAPTQVQPASAPVGSYAMTVVSGPLTGQRFEVAQPFEVGRDCPAIPMGFDSLVSRRHASFAPGPVGIVVTDLGSTNGTFVNDQRIQATTLRPGDLVKMGVTVFRVE
jgi:pSer/pThr/pTyr-binding forkhead associated (FHA) protein